LELLSYILFALALNLDSFGAGMAYGARQIKVPLLSLLIISLISVAAIIISMLGGQIFLSFIPAGLAHRLGGILLIIIGLWVLYQTRRSGQAAARDTQEENSENKMIKIHIRPLGLIVQILREPARADLDSSGVISPGEALVLGMALAMDALGAGFAVSMLGLSIVLTSLVVGLGHFFLTYLGLQAGRTITNCGMGRHLAILPGFILITLGMFKMF
jgi:putative sporulation protein YtaF